MQAAQLDTARFGPERIGHAISLAKNQLLDPDTYAQRATDPFAQVVAPVYARYQKQLRAANAMDFDDLLYLPARGLQQNQHLRDELDQRFRFVMIDEYQDTNFAQYQIARLLNQRYPNLCVVGDTDQSIYGWRGSDIRNILDFERDYPNARTILLTKNYRSTANIIHAASVLIQHNTQRKPKTLTTDNPAGEPVRVLTYETSQDEADDLGRRIRQAVDNGTYHYRDFAVFLRLNALSRSVESAFIKHGIPFQIVRGLAFFERAENRDVLAYLRLIVNPHDSLAFLRAVNAPARGVGKATLATLQSHAEQRGISLLAAASEAIGLRLVKGKALGSLHEFVTLIHQLRQQLTAPPDAIIRAVLERSGYHAALANSTDPDDQERLANVEELVTSAREFAKLNPTGTLSDYLEQIALASDVDSWDERDNRVSVMTLHASKGLEFPVVFMLAVEQGILPHERTLREREQIEEERRLCFVGMTRAMRELYLCRARRREFRGLEQYTISSPFLEELQPAVVHEDLGPRPAESGPSRNAGARATTTATTTTATNATAANATVTATTATAWQALGFDPRQPLTDRPAPPQASGLAVGQIVEHATYGKGHVVELAGHGAARRVTVRFASGGQRKFFVAQVKLRIISGSESAAPPPPPGVDEQSA
jgi:DNA helicase-2/ATP-dependent DNA helicase PcrA